jgi:hypothetical protein
MRECIRLLRAGQSDDLLSAGQLCTINERAAPMILAFGRT